MKKIPVKSLRAGSSFTEPVYIEGNNILVPAGIAIRKKDLDRLASWGVDSVTTDGEMINADEQAGEAKKAAEQKSGGLLSLIDVKENSSAYRTYMDLISKLDEVFTNIGAGIAIEVRSIDNITGGLLYVVREQRDQIIGFILGGEVSGRELAKSSVNTAILTALIALEMKLPNHKVMQITTGALLHDAGMLRLPKEITEKKGGLSAAEVQRMQAHPLYTYKIICKELLYPEDVGIVALQHHERWDGEGYPRRVSGTAIDLGARIVSVADAFEAMVSEKPYRNSMMGYQAMKNLLSDNSRRFDPDVLKAFIQTMGIYPIGSIILLNNGAIARVVEVRGDAPLRPNIRILIDEFGKVFKQDEGDLIELLTEKSLFIAKALDPRELNKKK
ncbi:MAG: HD-GYP domain-containing protein [Spirochaetaceae bacterium]|jgi:HD-GYP domain-containing protein (c-di-GMP phosphodiesterase class II)|nr:HD-GYP domain-containing protein [Spirochaetaceae bacterium]